MRDMKGSLPDYAGYPIAGFIAGSGLADRCKTERRFLLCCDVQRFKTGMTTASRPLSACPNNPMNLWFPFFAGTGCNGAD